MTVLVIGQNHWGHAKTLAEAKTIWRKRGGELSKGYTIIRFKDDQEFSGVNMFGEVSWTGNTDQPAVNEVAPR